jgi:SAM-dependent methyltransferase
MSVDWGERYRQGDTPWEKGEAHPGLSSLLEEHRALFDRARQILVPGCGLGHDARLISQESKASVTGLDLAPEAIDQARALTSEHGPKWEVGDLFAWQGSYDLVFEHTCFCAIPVERRPEYVRAMARLIPAGGFLLGVFFLKPDHEGEAGPPFGVKREALEQFFRSDFEERWSAPPRRTYESREGEGRELCLLLERQA